MSAEHRPPGEDERARAESMADDAELADWLARIAGALGLAPLAPEDIDLLLGLAGVVAHGTGRRQLAPLSAFLLGAATARETGERLSLATGRAAIEAVVTASASGTVPGASTDEGDTPERVARTSGKVPADGRGGLQVRVLPERQGGEGD